MGKTADQLQREIAEDRLRIERKLDALDERVRYEVRDTGSGLGEQLKDRVPLRDYAERAPMTTLAGAFGVGVLLGIFTDGKGPREVARGTRRLGQQGSNLIDELFGGASGMISGTFQDELRQLLRQFVGNDGASGANTRSDDGYERGEAVAAYRETHDEMGRDVRARYGDDGSPPRNAEKQLFGKMQ